MMLPTGRVRIEYREFWVVRYAHKPWKGNYTADSQQIYLAHGDPMMQD